MDYTTLIKVALNAARPGRVTYAKRVMYASFYRGDPVRAPSQGVTLAGYHYEPHELIPANVIMLADRADRDKLFALIEQDKEAYHGSRQPAPGQTSFLDTGAVDQDQQDRDRRDNAMMFFPPNVIASRGHSDTYKSNYEAMYDWMMDYFRDWYENLTDDQEAQAESFGRRIKIAGEMNPYLRGDRYCSYTHSSDGIEKGIHVFDSLVDDAPPIDRDLLVYRGISDTISLVPRGTSLKKGDVIDNNQFMSSTIDPRIATGGFMGYHDPDKLLMRIVLPKGTRTAPVTTWNIKHDHTSKSSFANGAGSHEMEFTLPRDSKLRIVSEPHEEEFQDDGVTKKIRVADFELLPQPTPEESPELPHRAINSFSTGRSKGFDSDYDDDTDDPWYDYDADSPKESILSDLETIIESYEENPAHDTEALEQIKNLKFDLDAIDHTDYSDPEEYEEALQDITSQAEMIVEDAPDHTDELWDAFDSRSVQRDTLSQLDGIISRFVRTHDVARPTIAEYLKQLKSIRDKIDTSLQGNLQDKYTYPDSYVKDLDKGLAIAKTAVDLAHHIDADLASNQRPLFLGQEPSPVLLKEWLNRNHLVGQHIETIRQFDPELADRVQALWNMATHNVPPGYEVQNLMELIEKGSARYAHGISPDASGYGLVRLSEMARGVNHQVMLHKSIQENVARARSQGIFQGGDVSQDTLTQWARKLYEFKTNLESYRKQQETAGLPVLPQAAQAQIYWDRASHELRPSYETMTILSRLVDYSDSLKNGHAYDYNLEDIKSRLNSQLAKEGSPSVKLGAKLDQLNDRYREAHERFRNSPYYDDKYKGYLARFTEYVKGKGLEGTKLEHLGKLSPEIQDQVFAQANALITNLTKASNGSLAPENIWPTPAEHVQAPASVAPASMTALDKLRYKVSKQQILDQFKDTVFEYNKLPHYSHLAHKQLNVLMELATTAYPDGPDQLAAMKEVVRRAENVANQTPSSMGALYDPLPAPRPAPPKMLTTHFFTKEDWQKLYTKKLTEISSVMGEYAKLPTYDPKQHADIVNGFFMHETPGAISQKLEQGTPESNQAIIDNFDNIIAHAKTLVGQPISSVPESAPTKSPSQVVQLINKIKQFENLIHENSFSPDTNVDLYDQFWANKLPAAVKKNFNIGTPEQKQAILDHMDTVIAKAQAPAAPPAEANTPSADQDWPDLFHDKIQHFRELKTSHYEAPHYDGGKETKANLDFWMHQPPMTVKTKFLNGTPEEKKAILDHFDKTIQQAQENFFPSPTETPTWPSQFHQIIQKAQGGTPPADDSIYGRYVANSREKPLPDFEAMYNATMGREQKRPAEPESSTFNEKSFEDTFSQAGEISYKLHNYEDMPLSNTDKLGELGDRYNELRNQWYENPKNDIHIMAQLTHLYNDVYKESEEHSQKLTKIANHAADVEPKLASGAGVKALETKFPYKTSQIHLDLANYQGSPHFDSGHYGLLVDLLDGAGHDWEKHHDIHDTHYELSDILKLTKKSATNNGMLPHQSIMPMTLKPLFEPAPAPTPAPAPAPKSTPMTSSSLPLTLPESRHPESRRTYDRMIRRVRSGNKVTLIDQIQQRSSTTLRLNYEKIVKRVFYANTQGESQEPLDFTPHHFVLHPDFDKFRGGQYYDKMHEFQMNHYGQFLKTLSPDEQRSLMPSKPDPIKISNMNMYLTGRAGASTPPSFINGVKKGIDTMDRIIGRSPPLNHDLIVYRGLGDIRPEDAPKPGSLLYTPGFQSTTLNAAISRHAFSDHDAVARIHIPAGTRLGPITAHQIAHFGIDSNEHGFKTMEQELLLGRGHHMVVTDPIYHNATTSTHFLNMKLLPQGPAPVSERDSPITHQGSWMVKRPLQTRTRPSS